MHPPKGMYPIIVPLQPHTLRKIMHIPNQNACSLQSRCPSTLWKFHELNNRLQRGNPLLPAKIHVPIKHHTLKKKIICCSARQPRSCNNPCSVLCCQGWALPSDVTIHPYPYPLFSCTELLFASPSSRLPSYLESHDDDSSSNELTSPRAEMLCLYAQPPSAALQLQL